MRRAKSLPRATIYEHRNAAGKVTLSGLHCRDLLAILTQASLHNYEAMKSAKLSSEDDAYHREMLALIARVEAVVMDAVAATHRPSSWQRSGCRRPAETPLRDLPKEERLRRVQQEMSEREWLKRAMSAIRRRHSEIA